MPNHVASIVTITGPAKELKRLLKAVTRTSGEKLKEYPFDFNALFPCPEDLKNVTSPVRIVSEEQFQKEKERLARIKAGDEKGSPFGDSISISESYQRELIRRFGSDNWYDWCVKNWGTKWGLYEVEQKKDGPKDALQFGFQTAWSPAQGFWTKISSNYPELTFRTEFADEGGGFVGTQTFQNGEMLEERELDWDNGEGLEVRTRVGYGPSEDEEDEEEVEA